ncbi:MAG: metallophosphoesterase family protein [Myxococcota bacterium]
MRLLCISDIHGHADALGAVLATAERHGYDRVLVGGDHCFPGPAPLATWRRLRQLDAVCVQGVGDRALATVDLDVIRARNAQEHERLRLFREARTALGTPLLRTLARLPSQRRLTLHPSTRDGAVRVHLVHGSPADPTEPLTHDMTEEALATLLGDEPSDLVICGASHVPFHRTIRRRLEATEVVTTIVNAGSVGEAPPSSAGGPERFAHATLVDIARDGIRIHQITVPLPGAA